MRIKLNKYFNLDEFVPPETYSKFKSDAIWFTTKAIIESAFHLRTKFGECTINDWYIGGDYKYSGYRPITCRVGADNSLHRCGKAADLKFKNATPEEVRNYIKSNAPIFLALGLTTIESNTDSWVHIDCRTTNANYILEVNG